MTVSLIMYAQLKLIQISDEFFPMFILYFLITIFFNDCNLVLY